MRVVDLDRDMSDVIPTGSTRDSTFLFERMTEATLAATGTAAGRRVLDVASGFGQDAVVLCERGAEVVGVEPSARMSGWARLASARANGARLGRAPGARPSWVRGFADALPFASQSFDAVYCKGALDHFDRPERALAEMARVARAEGRVVLAVANFDSLACRLARARDALREDVLRRPPRRGRRHYDVPADHFTRYELALLRGQAEGVLVLERVAGISLCWGLRAWSRLVERLPAPLARALLALADALARRLPALADVILIVGRPRAGQRS